MKSKRRITLILLLLFAFILVACDTDDEAVVDDVDVVEEDVDDEPVDVIEEDIVDDEEEIMEEVVDEEPVEEEMVEEEIVEEEEMGPITVGFLGPLTGGAAFLGQEQLNFARVALDVFSEETGIEFVLLEGDTMIEPDEAMLVTERFLADEDLVAVVGPAGSQVCEAVQPLFAEAGVAHITPSCTRISLTDPGTETFFRPIPHDGLQGPTVAAYMFDELGARSAFLVDDQSSYAVGLTDEVEAALSELGVDDVERASVTQDETDFSSLVTTIIADDPDVVFFPSQIASQLGTMAAQLQEQGYEGDYFLGDGGFDISWVETAGDAAEGTYVSFFAPDPRFVEEMQPYTERYEEQYGEFGAFGGPAALAADIIAHAVERCADAGAVTRDCVRDEIAATDMDPSILGVPVSFDENGQLVGGEFFIFQVQGDEFVLVGP